MKRSTLAAALALLLAGPDPARSDEAIGPGSVEEAAALEDGSRLWFVELSGPPTSEGGDLRAIEEQRAAFRARAAQAGVRYKERHAFSKLWNGLSIAVPPADAEKLQRMEDAAGLYPVLSVTLPPDQDVHEPELLTALAMTGADVAHNTLGLTGAGIKVGLIDTGIDYDHSDLGGDGVARSNSSAFPTARVVAGYDFVGDAFNGANKPEPDSYPDDCYGHGTHVAGIIGASGAVDGVAPGVTFCAYRVFGCSGDTPSDILLEAMERAFDDGVQVVNMSFGAAYEWPNYPTAVASSRLVERGVVVVASIGNGGSSGLYSGGAPGVGENVIGVAAFDNTFIHLPAFSISPDAHLASYEGGTAVESLPPPPSSGTYPVARTSTAFTSDDACSPLPAGSLLGSVALIRRGTCSPYTQARDAQDAGATAAVIYDDLPGVFIPDVTGKPAITIPVVSITAAEGAFISSRLALGPVSLTWGAVASEPNPTGGLISSFSSFGMAPDLTLKPDLGAPGGFIRSTYPLEQGGYTSLSGTSMSSPHVAGAVALLLQAHPGTPADAVRDILMNSAQPRALAADMSMIDNVHRQGAGMLNIPGAVLATTRIAPGKLSLGESERGPVTRTLRIENRASSDVTYRLSSLTAAGTGPNTFTVTYNDLPASVRFSRNPVRVPANGTATLSVAIAPDSGQPAQSLYGGYLVFSPEDGGQEYRVPYAGFCGDYQSIPSLTPAGSFGLPWLTQKVGTFYFNRSLGATYTMVGQDIPFIILHIDHQASLLRMDLFDARTGRSWHRAYERRYMPRNESSGGAFVIGWNGTTTRGRVTESVPDGRYVMKVSALRALGDGGNPAHWDSWTSPVITLARPGSSDSSEGVTGVAGPGPKELALGLPGPNPSSGEVVLGFDLPQGGPAMLELFDIGGRRLRRWRWASLPAGRHSVRWDGSGDTGTQAGAGTVVLRLTAMGRTVTCKAVRLP